MNGKEYRNIIERTIKLERSDDKLEMVRAIFKNMGVALPHGDCREINEVLKSDDYMGWKNCSVKEAREAVDSGVAAIAINDEEISIIVPPAENSDEMYLQNNISSDILMVVDEETSAYSVSNVQFYANSNATTTNSKGSDEDQYISLLMDEFKFNAYVAWLIVSLYDKVGKKFSHESNNERAWRCARLLGGIVYDHQEMFKTEVGKFLWNDVAGIAYDGSEEQYFTGTLGYTNSEYTRLRNAILAQHADAATPDFAHMQISIAARLAYTLNKDNFISNIGTGYSDLDISYLAGWFGDATLIENGNTTSFGDDDYHADLDAENIYHYIICGWSSVKAMIKYYDELSASFTRADLFKIYISYDTVKEKIFKKLVDDPIIYPAIVKAYDERNVELAAKYRALLSDESYHFKVIYNKYRDTYNFLLSLRDGLPHIRNYI